MEISKLEIASMELKPGDVVILKADAIPSREVIARIEEYARGVFPNNKVLVLDRNFDISVCKAA